MQSSACKTCNAHSAQSLPPSERSLPSPSLASCSCSAKRLWALAVKRAVALWPPSSAATPIWLPAQRPSSCSKSKACACVSLSFKRLRRKHSTRLMTSSEHALRVTLLPKKNLRWIWQRSPETTTSPRTPRWADRSLPSARLCPQIGNPRQPPMQRLQQPKLGLMSPEKKLRRIENAPSVLSSKSAFLTASKSCAKMAKRMRLISLQETIAICKAARLMSAL